jgi:hypothetical protein
LQARAKTVGPSPSMCSVEPYAGAGLGHYRCERSLPDLKRIMPQVVAVLFNEVEGVQERGVIMAAVANEIERGHAVLIASDSLAIDDAGARAQACQRLDYQRETAGKVIARTTVESHSHAVLPGDDSKAVVLDLVQPLAAGRQFIGFGREARRDKPAGRVRCNIRASVLFQKFLVDHLGL